MELTVEKKGTDYSCDQTITVVSRGNLEKGTGILHVVLRSEHTCS